MLAHRQLTQFPPRSSRFMTDLKGKGPGADHILEVKDLKIHFAATGGLFDKTRRYVKAVDGVDVAIDHGQTVGIVGESGCGKTTLSRAMLFLVKPSSGHIYFRGRDLVTLDSTERRSYRRTVQAVFQDPTSSLNPRIRVKDIISEPLVATGQASKSEVMERLNMVMRQMGLSPSRLSDFPHEFSGGQRQRIAIARALITSPELIILDEPVSALDVSVRAQMLNLLADIQGELNIAYVMIAHDLAAVEYLSRTILVMYLGKIVEAAEGSDIAKNALHPYTKVLLSAVLPHHPSIEREEVVPRGEVPSPLNVPSGCRFHPRCDYAKPICRQEIPLLKAVGERHSVACHLY